MNPIMQRLFNEPLAIRERDGLLIAALAQSAGIEDLAMVDALDDGPRQHSARYGRAGGYDVLNGIARIAIEGTLVHKLGCLRPWNGMTGFDGIRLNLLGAVADDGVRAIILDVDSPGGEVAGCFDLADMIYEMRAAKPIWAIMTERGYAGAYALASSASRVILPRTGEVGSIGILALHVDISKAMKEAGLTVTVMKYGAHKDDGADIAPLGNIARKRIQANLDRAGGLLDALVARNRKIPEAKIKSFQAATFMGAAAVKAGLADAVMAPDAAFKALLAEVPPRQRRVRPQRRGGRK